MPLCDSLSQHQARPSGDPLTTVLLRGVERCQIADPLERSKQVYFILKQQVLSGKESISSFTSSQIHALRLNTSLHPQTRLCFQQSSWTRHVHHHTHRCVPDTDGTTSSIKACFSSPIGPSSQLLASSESFGSLLNTDFRALTYDFLIQLSLGELPCFLGSFWMPDAAGLGPSL